MGTFANIVCKGVGITGMSALLYDAYSVGQANSTRVSQSVSADFFQKVHSDTRTTAIESPVISAIQEKTNKMRMNNPFIPIIGNIKGFVSGALGSWGDNIIPASLASLAIATKGIFSKIGALGVAGYGIFTVAREGFGIAKKSPMN